MLIQEEKDGWRVQTDSEFINDIMVVFISGETHFLSEIVASHKEKKTKPESNTALEEVQKNIKDLRRALIALKGEYDDHIHSDVSTDTTENYFKIGRMVVPDGDRSRFHNRYH